LEFAFVPTSQQKPLKPRKRPVQARSETTVSALFEASIQVLLAVGYRKLTTTRVAARAGVSVGTLYQYFPNRQALIASVIERHLEDVTGKIELACENLHGRSLEAVATGLVDAFISAKCARAEVSRALHEPLADVGGAELVRTAEIRAARCIAGVLSRCSDAAFDDEHRLAMLVVVSSSSLLQTSLAGTAAPLDPQTLGAHMRAMVLGYLREMRSPAAHVAAAE
jgi:AcrR family transcriptional regulator